MTDPRARSGLLAAVVMAVVVAVFYAGAAGHFSYTTDDSYIYFRYAGNLAAGDGPAFNEGEPSYGFTSPLWLLMLAAGGAAGADIVLAGKALDLLFASLSVALFFFLAYELARDAAVAFCAALAFSVNAWLLRWAGSGLETSLGVFLLLAFLLSLLRNRYEAAAGLLGLLALVRPEAALLLPLLLWDLRVNSTDRGRMLRTGLRAAGIWTAVLLPWTVYAYARFGTVLPSTFAAKRGGLLDPAGMAGAAADIARTLASADGAALFCLIVSAAALAFRSRRAAGDAGAALDFYRFRQGLVGTAWMALLPAAYVLFSVNPVSRYLLLATPAAVALAFFFLHELVRDRRPALRYGLVVALTAAVMIQNQWITARHVAPHLAAFTMGVESCLVPIAGWLREHSPPGAVVLTGDVGALGYFSGRRICDFNGIVTPDVRAPRRDNESFTQLLREGAWDRYCAPDYVVHRSPVAEELSGVPGLVPVLSRPFPGLSISDPSIVYFTLYRVDRSRPARLLTSGGDGG